MKLLPNTFEPHQTQHNLGIADRSFVFLLLVIIIVGAGFGYFTANSQPPVEAQLPANSLLSAAGGQHQASEWLLHRFPLGEAEASDGIEAPALAVLDSGKIVVAWAVESAVRQRQVLLATSHDEGGSFSDPHPVATTGIHTSVAEVRGRTIKRRMRTLPQLVSAGDTLYLAWVDAKETRESVVLRLAESTDNGVTFDSAVAVHQCRDSRPTFVSLSASPDKTIVCSWLDNRNRVQQPFAAVRRAGEPQFDLERIVYAGPAGRGICPCCPTASLISGKDVLVAFRGHETGYRDMWVASAGLTDLPFQPPTAIVPPTWEFAGCPHDGPAMCATSRGIHLAWMDGHTGTQRIYVKTRGANNVPTAIGGSLATGFTQGHPQLIADKDTLHLVWDQTLPALGEAGAPGRPLSSENDSNHHGQGAHGEGMTGGRAICYAASHDGGQTFSTPLLVSPVPGSFQTRPKICVLPNGALVFVWMELGESGKDVVIAVSRMGPEAHDDLGETEGVAL